MANNGEASRPVPLIKRVLHGEDSVRIGRKASCELSVKCPFISGTHCKVDVTSGAKSSASAATKTSSSAESSCDHKSGGGVHFFVQDLSSNGTWVVSPRRPGDAGGKGTKKLEAKTKEKLHVGDCILLLAPSHKESTRYRFMLTRGRSEYKLEQLPTSYNLNGEVSERTSREEGGGKVAMSPDRARDGKVLESVVVGRKRSTSSAGSDTANSKKLCVAVSKYKH